jgi:hypothetical protein
MNAPAFFNLIVTSVAGAPGTGDITLGVPRAPYLGLSNYPTTIADGTKVSYSLTDGTSNSEIGLATYRTPAASGTTYGKLTGRTVTTSTASGNAAISASAATTVRCSPRAEDLGSAAGLVPSLMLGLVPNDPTAASANDTALANWASGISGSDGILFAPGIFYFGSSHTINISGGGSVLNLKGSAKDATQLYWATGNGLTVNLALVSNSIHVSDLSFVTGAANSGSPLSIAGATAFFGTFVATSSFTRVAFRGSDSYTGTPVNYWTVDLSISNVSNCAFVEVDFLHDAGYHGIGFEVFSSGTSGSVYGIQYDFLRCNFNFPNYGAQIGVNIQNLTFEQCYFWNGNIGIVLPTQSSPDNAGMQQISVINCTFDTNNDAIYVGTTAYPYLQLIGNVFNAKPSIAAINLNSCQGIIAKDNFFIPYVYGQSTRASQGIYINNSVAGYPGIIDGNVFIGYANPIYLDSNASEIVVGVNNIAWDTLSSPARLMPVVTTVGAAGTNNLIGLGALSNAIGSDVSVSHVAWTDGPSITITIPGTYEVNGYLTLVDTAGAALWGAIIWDSAHSTIAASGAATQASANQSVCITLGGLFAVPAGGATIVMSANDQTSTSGSMKHNLSGGGKDCQLIAKRVGP